MIMNQNKEYFFRLVESKYSLGSKSCFAAIGFININNQPHVLDGYVVDKYIPSQIFLWLTMLKVLKIKKRVL